MGVTTTYTVSISGSENTGFTITNTLRTIPGGGTGGGGGSSTPSGGGGGTTTTPPATGVKTGDDTPIGLWLAIMIAAMAAASGAVAVSRRRRKEQE